MGRYDRKTSRKASKTPFFIVIMLIPLLIGGLWYFRDQLKRFMVPEAAVLDAVKQIPVADGFPDEKQDAEDEQLKFLPMQPEPIPLAAKVATPVVPQVSLPDLLSSDDFVRQSLSQLSPGLAYWLGVDQLLRKVTLIVNDFAQSYRVSNHMSFLRLEEPFSVEQGGNGQVIAPKSFRRYDRLAQAIQVIDAKAAATLYQKLRPLTLQIFAEFSYPKDITLESLVKKAAAEVLAAPTLVGQVNVIRPSVYYKFADPNIEALSPVQKQMIRMGGENTRIIQTKCREFLVELGKIDIR